MKEKYTKTEMIEKLDKIDPFDIGDSTYNSIKEFIEDL